MSIWDEYEKSLEQIVEQRLKTVINKLSKLGDRHGSIRTSERGATVDASSPADCQAISSAFRNIQKYAQAMTISNYCLSVEWKEEASHLEHSFNLKNGIIKLC